MNRLRGAGPSGRAGWGGWVLLACVVAATTWTNPAESSLRPGTADGTASSPNARVSIVKHPIAVGECFGEILTGYGVPPSEVQRWYQAARAKLDLRRVLAGRLLTLGFVGNQQLDALRYDIDDTQQLVVKRTDGGNLRVTTEASPAHVRVVGARGTVQRTFYAAAQRSGVPDSIISSIVDLLAWKVDFNSEVHPGDRFRVLYEQRTTLAGRPLKPGRVLAADFVGAAQTAAAFLYETDQGKSVYVDGDGKALDGALLRYPLEFTRITSTFSGSRSHPILKKRRPHLGVDFAAPTGTPVRAVGAGTVRWSGWKGGLGRHVEIDHGDGLVSAYSHLRSFHRGVRKHAHVNRGQVIGRVGMSGRATGAHLHFAIFLNGRYLNPLKRSGRVQATVVVDAEKFEQARAALATRLRAIPGSFRGLH